MSNPWWLAVRLKTLSISMVPVAVGAALADVEGVSLQPLLLLMILLAALLIQIGTNLYNDAGDAERGADGPDRLGPKRMVAEGVLGAGQVRGAALGCFSAALLIGIYLVWVGGVPILLIGLLSIGAGIAYTGGRLPIAYTLLGELFVFLFFGVAAVAGTYWLMALQWSPVVIWAGSITGLQAAAVLVVNNYRDIETDRRAGKRTLAVHLGKRITRWLYLLLLLLPFLLIVGLAAEMEKPLLIWVIIPAVPIALYLGREIYRILHGTGLNQLLAHTAQLQVLFGVLMILGIEL